MIINQCLLCGSKNFKTIFKKNAQEILQCRTCSFAMLKNYPSLQETKKIYQKDYFDNKKTLDFPADAQKKFNFIKRYLKPKVKVLDFGCGLGDFIGVIKKEKFKPYGYDLSSSAAEFVRKKYRIPCLSSSIDLQSFPKDFFDAITCFDVIEHAPNFKTIMNFFGIWLKPKGYLFITTPNLYSWDAKVFRSAWYGFKKIPEHINYFSPKTIKILLEGRNFKIVKIKTWGFVRSIDFLLNHFEDQNSFLIKSLKKIAGFFKINNKLVYLPMIDMIVVAQKL